jgi:hypothetical protein
MCLCLGQSVNYTDFPVIIFIFGFTDTFPKFLPVLKQRAEFVFVPMLIGMANTLWKS